MKNFAIIGVAGFVSPRHLKAIHDTGNRLVAAADPNDSVGILDRYSFHVKFFREIERFDRHLEKLRRGPTGERVQYVSICTPNYLHDAHVRLAFRVDADAICEKPLVINPWNLDALQELERERGRRVWTVLQLRLHPTLIGLKKRLAEEQISGKHEVVLTYITARGPWYHVSWKGSLEKSGGLASNIGIHFFDLLLWLFGGVEDVTVHRSDPSCLSGCIELRRARVRWFLSVDIRDLPLDPVPGKRTTFRSITVDGQEIEFTEGFTDLHTRVYEETLAGRGFGIEEARPSIELVHAIRQKPVTREGIAPPTLAQARISRG
jgi:UDP-N-acetyl-2-amino-2-deoxyglucuronate dehydrogenase